MNVSISAVVHDLHTTVSGVQSAIALEALVSAAFILISSKVGDLMGRKRAFMLGLIGYAIGALPAMQSLIHGNFEGAAQKRAYALVGASAAIAAAIGPLLGGFEDVHRTLPSLWWSCLHRHEPVRQATEVLASRVTPRKRRHG
jgi:hypothetical protein